jgi:diguanylate cyclase (GGDEF)-like protein/PAS domain S-box-containing protein
MAAVAALFGVVVMAGLTAEVMTAQETVSKQTAQSQRVIDTVRSLRESLDAVTADAKGAEAAKTADRVMSEEVAPLVLQLRYVTARQPELGDAVARVEGAVAEHRAGAELMRTLHRQKRSASADRIMQTGFATRAARHVRSVVEDIEAAEHANIVAQEAQAKAQVREFLSMSAAGAAFVIPLVGFVGWRWHRESSAQQAEASRVRTRLMRSSEAAVGMDESGRIVQVNGRVEPLFGYQSEELLGQPIQFLIPDRVEPAHIVASASSEHQGATGQGDSQPSHESRPQLYGVRKDGSAFPVSMTVRSVVTDQGRVVWATIRDVSSQVREGEGQPHRQEAEHGVPSAELEARRRTSMQVQELTDLLQRCTSVEEVQRVMERSMPRIFPGSTGQIGVMNAAKTVESVSRWGVSSSTEPTYPGEQCWAVRRGQVHAMSEGGGTPFCAHVRRGQGHASLCVPMIVRGEVMGVLYVSGPSDRRSDTPMNGSVSAMTQEFAVAVAGVIGMTLASVRSRQGTPSGAVRDPLTNAYSRQYLEEMLESELRRAGRKQRRLGAIVVDVDHFRRFNETYGQETGDMFLKELANTLRSRIRREDVVCRYGGEEFVMILPEASAEATRQCAEQVREDARLIRVQAKGKTAEAMTVSVGVAVYPDHGVTPENLLSAAQGALTQAKNQGRNRVAIAQTPAWEPTGAELAKFYSEKSSS